MAITLVSEVDVQIMRSLNIEGKYMVINQVTDEKSFIHIIAIIQIPLFQCYLHHLTIKWHQTVLLLPSILEYFCVPFGLRVWYPHLSFLCI